MDARQLVATIAPGANVREVASGANKIFRIIEDDGSSSVIKVYASASRERRERHALEALAGTHGVPAILDRGTDYDTPWIRMVDGGAWTLATLPENHQLARRAGAILRAVHDTAGTAISNLEGGMDGDWVGSHYFSTLRRLERYRRRLLLSPDLLRRALTSPPPRGGNPRPGHTNPRPGKFAVNDAGDVMLLDWEWGTLAPPEWDLSLALWRMKVEVTPAAADALHAGYGATLPDDRLRPWIAFHTARWMLDAAERRDGRLGDLDYLRDELEAALAHS